MLKALKVDYGMSNVKLIDLSFKDEQTILTRLKKMHIHKAQRNAAIKIQATAKMYMIRKRYVALIRLRTQSAALLTRYFR